MGAIYLSTAKMKNGYLGTSKIKQIYLGTSKIFSAGISFYIGSTYYEWSPDSGAQMYTITSNTSVRFVDFDSSTYKITACLIGGGGGSSAISFHWEYYHGDTDIRISAGAGGEGGQVQTFEFNPTIGSSYSAVIGAGGAAGTHTRHETSGSAWGYSENETSGSAGGSSSFAGYTSVGGNGGTVGHASEGTLAHSYGGTGRAGADGGAGGFCNSDENTSGTEWDYAGTAGSAGTLFNGTYYGGGGGSGGASYAIQNYWAEYWTSRSFDGGSAGAGQGTYGGGGNGKSGSGSARDGYWASVTADAAGNPGNQGALLLLLQSR